LTRRLFAVNYLKINTLRWHAGICDALPGHISGWRRARPIGSGYISRSKCFHQSAPIHQADGLAPWLSPWPLPEGSPGIFLLRLLSLGALALLKAGLNRLGSLYEAWSLLHAYVSLFSTHSFVPLGSRCRSSIILSFDRASSIVRGASVVRQDSSLPGSVNPHR
jgi:hypothetical protein